MPVACTLIECLSDLPDPRAERARRHNLLDILVIALCALICGAEGWDDIVLFAHAKRDWLQERLELPNGIPSADTFRRVFARLDPEVFRAAFRTWIEAVQHTLPRRRGDQVICVDGKTLRHSFDTASQQSPIHMVSAWAGSLRLVLGQVKTDAKSNEITAVPALLALLDLHGCIVTADAMSCQKAIVSQIMEQGGDYILTLKDNQPHLHEDARLLFAHALEHRFEEVSVSYAESVEKGHGRIETRRCWQIDLNSLNGLWEDVLQEWAGLASILRVERLRSIGEKTTQEIHYYISSLSGDAKKAARALRQHWGIENSVHWVLDVVFDEDACRIRKDNAPENLAIVRHIALNLVEQEKSHKRGIKAKRKRAGWDNDYLTYLLQI